MGFENRDYARTDNRSYSVPRSRMSIVGWIIAVTIAVFVVQCVWLGEGRVSILDEWFSLKSEEILSGQIWRLATYDFLHSTSENLPWHLVFNMYVLYLTGRKIVDVYSEREFLLFYLLAGVLSGLFFLLWGVVTGGSGNAIGASGAVAAVMVLYAMRWPNDQWTIFYVLPVKAIWMVAIYAALDLYPMLKQLGRQPTYDNVAHSAHIGGMLFGFFYARHHWQLESLLDRLRISNPLKRRPKLRVVRDHDEPSHPEFSPRQNVTQLKNRLDELLAKITEQGQASLTESERNELNEASRYFREHR